MTFILKLSFREEGGGGDKPTTNYINISKLSKRRKEKNKLKVEYLEHCFESQSP